MMTNLKMLSLILSPSGCKKFFYFFMQNNNNNVIKHSSLTDITIVIIVDKFLKVLMVMVQIPFVYSSYIVDFQVEILFIYWLVRALIT